MNLKKKLKDFQMIKWLNLIQKLKSWKHKLNHWKNLITIKKILFIKSKKKEQKALKESKN